MIETMGNEAEKCVIKIQSNNNSTVFSRDQSQNEAKGKSPNLQACFP